MAGVKIFSRKEQPATASAETETAEKDEGTGTEKSSAPVETAAEKGDVTVQETACRGAGQCPAVYHLLAVNDHKERESPSSEEITEDLRRRQGRLRLQTAK